MEFFYVLLITLVIYYVGDFWRAHRSKQPWAVKKLNPMGGQLADRAETVPVDYEEEVSYPSSVRERKEQHTQRREAEAASKNQRNEV